MYWARILPRIRQTALWARSGRHTASWRALLGWLWVLWLRWFRDPHRPGRSGRDHGISPAIAYRRLDDVITVLADEAPDPHQALALREQMSVRSLSGLSSLSVRRRGGA